MRLTTSAQNGDLLLCEATSNQVFNHFSPVHVRHYHIGDCDIQHQSFLPVKENGKMDTLAKRLVAAREDAGLTQSQLAKYAGIKSQGTIGMLESGERKTSAYIPKIANALKVSALWLAEGVGPREPGIIARAMEPQEVDPDIDYQPVKRVLFKLSAGVSGFEVEAEDGESAPIYFRRDWFKAKGLRPDKLLAVKVSGDSMVPSLYDGDLVVVNTEHTTPRDGEVFAANYEGEMVIKRVRLEKGTCWLDSDAADQNRFKPRECGDRCFILGRVVYKQSERI